MFSNGLSFAALLSSVALTHAAVPYLHVVDLGVTDIRSPSESHSISYTVSTPNAVYEQGYADPYDVSISWNGCDPPTCWTPAGNFYNRVTPGSYKGANDFQLDVYKYWFYRSPSLFNVTLNVVEGTTTGYGCEESGPSQKTCALEGEAGLTADWAIQYWQDAVMPSPVC
ncbi:unnamed protein product [Zymoseptoria tritici ST99CH_1A5]|uniref:Uncharacterized protein n=3 Tax=Zymoseptoria tritici TaxID=1047171 RepID=F9X581_ZYMTI|nr:uncharacterized protein MYCGRDRAFT_99676 [Zymoseptoria tritici IPO323]EGP89255.1 hypothetical protein MYCGRDRAFT_99676 [Zymoseptoria tritici IPO323]SMQ49178.1 unnamed protein product [Zymoseptoria tritici ST99CH_3D7]SMR50180.1 unnamed protein product [Zymoseptoria tritici ST99CH_3D1]SMY22881.1 unnamed protein product [Zymoseptoria tritici ST99CH_1A5]